MSFTLISNARSGVFARPIALARSSPHVGGQSALVVDHTPVGAFFKGVDFIPQPDIFNLKIKQLPFIELYRNKPIYPHFKLIHFHA